MSCRLPVYLDWSRWLAWAIEFDREGCNMDKVCFTMGNNYLIGRLRNNSTWR